MSTIKEDEKDKGATTTAAPTDSDPNQLVISAPLEKVAAEEEGGRGRKDRPV